MAKVKYDAIICLGAIEVVQVIGIIKVARYLRESPNRLNSEIPVMFDVLTTELQLNKPMRAELALKQK